LESYSLSLAYIKDDNMIANNKYFIRGKGKGEFKTYHLINAVTFDMLDSFFNSEEDAKDYAEKNLIEIIEYVESFELEIDGN